MSIYILVHGAYHGAWCYAKIVPLLEAAGHTAIAVDLPGHRDNLVPLADVTLDSDHSPFLSAPEELADHLLSP